MGRARYLAIRSVQTVALLWIIMTFLFFFFRAMPGSYTDLMVYQGAGPEVVEAFEARWGLNEPVHVQYWSYLTNYLTLDAGTSIQYRVPVWDYVSVKIFNTAILAIPGITLSYIIGTAVGSYIGDKRGSLTEKNLTGALLLFGSFPGFFIAIMFIIIFGVILDVVPTSGMISTSVTNELANAAWWRPYLTTDFAMHYILPLSVVTIRGLIGPTMVMRTSVVEVTGQDFSYYQRVTGLPYRRRLQHLGRHAILPVVTLYPVSIVRSIGGLVLIEMVFNWPGIGYTLVQSVFARDFPIVQFIFFVMAAGVILANFAVDILYGVIDPRVNLGE